MSVAAASFHNKSWDFPIRRTGFSMLTAGEVSPRFFHHTEHLQRHTTLQPPQQLQELQQHHEKRQSEEAVPSQGGQAVQVSADSSVALAAREDNVPLSACQALPGASRPDQQGMDHQAQDGSIIQKFSALSVHVTPSLHFPPSPSASPKPTTLLLSQESEQILPQSSGHAECQPASQRMPLSWNSRARPCMQLSSGPGDGASEGPIGPSPRMASTQPWAVPVNNGQRAATPAPAAAGSCAVFSSLDAVDEHSPPFSPAGAPLPLLLCEGRALSFPTYESRSNTGALPLCTCLGTRLCSNCAKGSPQNPLHASASTPAPPRHNSMADEVSGDGIAQRSTAPTCLHHRNLRQLQHEQLGVRHRTLQLQSSSLSACMDAKEGLQLGEMWLFRHITSQPGLSGSMPASDEPRVPDPLHGGWSQWQTLDMVYSHPCHDRVSPAPGQQDRRNPGSTPLPCLSGPHNIQSLRLETSTETEPCTPWGLEAQAMASSSLSLSQDCSDSLDAGEVSSPMYARNVDATGGAATGDVMGDCVLDEAESSFSPGPASCPASVSRDPWSAADVPGTSPPGFSLPPAVPTFPAAVTPTNPLNWVLGTSALSTDPLHPCGISSAEPVSPPPTRAPVSPISSPGLSRGLSSYFGGKSRSFTSLAEVTSIQSIQELAKPVRMYNRRKRVSGSSGSSSGRDKGSSGGSSEGSCRWLPRQKNLFKKSADTRQSLGIQASLAVAFALGSFGVGGSCAGEGKAFMETVVEESAEAMMHGDDVEQRMGH